MMRALIVLLACAAALVSRANQVMGGMIVNFAGQITEVPDEIGQYFAVGDTFSGGFEYNPDTTGTPLSTPGDVGGRVQYVSAITDFALTFTSGDSEGYSINGIENSNSSIEIRDDVPATIYDESVIDIASGSMVHGRDEFRPGVKQMMSAFSFQDSSNAALVDSTSLTDWSPDQVFANFDSQSSILVFELVETGAIHSVNVEFTTFGSDSAPTPPETIVQEIAIGTEGPVEATLFEGSDGSTSGQLNVRFEVAPAEGGDFIASYSRPTSEAFGESYAGKSGFDLGNFVATGSNGELQVWDLDFTGTLSDGAEVVLQFVYDDTGLSAAEEAALGIWHYGEYGLSGTDQWKWLRDSIDTDGNVITVTVDNFSPFGVGFQSVPEPSSLVLLGMGALGLVGFGRRRRTGVRTVSSGA